jgi:hypothetical protein
VYNLKTPSIHQLYHEFQAHIKDGLTSKHRVGNTTNHKGNPFILNREKMKIIQQLIED